ncbi:LysM peptidoglycan-binding domain-containing protein [Aquibacillus halophilus]|uniref:LysM peptidoglycan-binding domain-containing protein n=1 Tax=Aquibacillus halophilus TaxID=930132 RepID=A0A6A8DDV3_9BACI|nr:cell wall hydrolase [Aquibacillus halophilus]MRH43420.1 LysM peptidoglycan-binding domain-containing protein [Aquibacillus halophilus]
MNKFKKVLLAASLSISFMIAPSVADAASYTVQKGDSFWTISNKYGVSLSGLLKTNNRTGSLLYAGETLSIPSSITNAEKELMARLVHAEAKGEPYAGKVAVATVILNRVDSSLFPNSVNGVIYERSAGGYYAFSPVQNGAINYTANAEAKRAVNEALAFRGQGAGSIYFYNPKTATSTWITSRKMTVTIGNHRFAK